VRPDPDQLLKRVQADEESAGRGKLKLFFGASPGVGKTYAMLEAARQRKKEEWDVVVGLVETHGRAETEALLEGLEVLPRKEVPYKAVVLHEFDLEGALARRPRLLVLDELAHTNADGLRHAKRWQDVDELLDAGIDVYTTLNVQHWESLNDVVAQVTGVVVRETVPDAFLQGAHDLELVDLAPEDLLKRLKEGKVYKGELADRAMENFFKPGNLIALRELALRHAAERVDVQMQAYKERHAIGEVWSVRERIMVGVTSSPLSARLVRAASRLATRLRAPWMVVHVENQFFLQSPTEDQSRLVQTLRLAEKLGAETVTLTGENVAEELLALARARNVTRLVMGKPARARWRDRLFGSIVDNVARHSGNMDLHIITGVAEEDRPYHPVKKKKLSWRGTAWGAILVAAATGICWPFYQILDPVNLVMIYLAAIMWTAYRFGRRASIVASVLSVLVFDFFFVPPFLTFAVGDAQYTMTFAVMLAVGLMISTITSRLRWQTETLRRREERTRALYRLSRELSETPGTKDMFQLALTRLTEFYHRPILLLTPGPDGALAIDAGDPAAFAWTENERSVARWVYDKGQMAGAGSDTLSGAVGLYLPLRGIRSTVGVLAIRPAVPQEFLDPESLQLLETFASEIGGALDSTRLSEKIGRDEKQAELAALARPAAGIHPRLGDFLTPDRMMFLASGLSRERIIRDLLSRLDLPNPTQAFQAIIEREKSGPTLMGASVAVPHARLDGVKGLHAAFGVSREGPVTIWIVFLSDPSNPKLHLGFLSSISQFFLVPGREDALRALPSTNAVLNSIRELEIPYPIAPPSSFPRSSIETDPQKRSE
jgi:two-component system sensor histidine kinase KdpD